MIFFEQERLEGSDDRGEPWGGRSAEPEAAAEANGDAGAGALRRPIGAALYLGPAGDSSDDSPGTVGE